MPTPTNAFTVLNHPSLDNLGVDNAVLQSGRRLGSMRNLQGKTVGIPHNGSLYRLQATKLGILTKMCI
jgi:hemin uptake protein HemP